MLEILESPKHLVAMRVSGTLTGEEIEKAHKAANEALDANERVSMFVHVDGSLGFTVEGFLKDLWNSLGELGRIGKFYRAAVVTDKGWIATLARVEGIVFSSMQVRVFETKERDKAFAWASEEPEPLPKPEDAPPAIHFLQTTSENVFAYEIDGRLREKDIKSAVEAMKPFLDREGKFNVLARMKNFSGFDLLSLLDDDLAKVKYKSLSKVEKYAIIGASAWMRNFIELLSGLLSVEIRFFDNEEEHAAWEWVGAEQALLAGK